MRLDKYLKVTRLIKRRTIANEACDAGRILVNGKPARASYEVKVGDIIEIGTCEEVFYTPQHPYTWALLSSLPQLGVKGENLYSIQGTPPNLFADIQGDAFAPRNPHALEIDFLERPPYFDVSPTHKARTWLLDPRAPKVEPPENIRKLREQGGRAG